MRANWFEQRAWTRAIERARCRMVCRIKSFFLPKVLESSCSSVVKGKGISFRRHFVREASQVICEILVRMPFAARFKRVRFDLVQLTSDGQVRWAAPLRQVGARQGSRIRFQAELDRLCWAEQDSLELAVVERGFPGMLSLERGPPGGPTLPGGDRVIEHLEWEALPASRIVPLTQKRIRQRLHVGVEGVWVEAGGLRIRTDQVPTSSNCVLVALTVWSSGFNAFFPKWETTLSLGVVAGGRLRVLGVVPIILRERAPVSRVIPIPVKESMLATVPAALCWVTVAVGGNETGLIPLRVLGEGELRQQVRVRQIWIDAVDTGGACVRQVAAVRRTRCHQLQATVVAETDVLAPNSSLTATAIWSCAGAAVYRSEFTLTLDRAVQQVALPPMEVGALLLGESDHPLDLTLEVALGADPSVRAHVLLLPDERVTNFEGQLTIDPGQLVIHEAEYEQILARLNLPPKRTRAGFSSGPF
jgi:hypothetical protein